MEWFPEDAALATRIAEHLRTHEEYLPTGERLTDHRFQMAGHYLGGRWRERGLHYFLETAFAEGDDRLSDQFLSSMSSEVSFLAILSMPLCMRLSMQMVPLTVPCRALRVMSSHLRLPH